MDPSEYRGSEWTELARRLSPRPLRNALKRAYRAEAKKAVSIARNKLSASGMQVQGSRSDWVKGVRSHIYSRGGGFLVTVKPNRTGDKSMHLNRYGQKKPVLMWAEEGTMPRRTKSNGGRHSRMFTRRRRGSHYTGRMPAYGFLDKAAPEMYREVERGLAGEIEKAVAKAAAKCGFV